MLFWASRNFSLPLRRDSLRQKIEIVRQLFPTSVSIAHEIIRSLGCLQISKSYQLLRTSLYLARS
jgi:hypothetical protein